MAGVRDYKQLSSILKEISLRLLADQTLCKLLYYNDTDPLSHPDMTKPQRRKMLNSEIRFLPRVGPQETTKSKIVMLYPGADKSAQNNDIIQLPIHLFIYTPFSEWVINGAELRIFYIMSRVEELLDGKDIQGIGRMKSLGFEMELTTDELCCYRMEFITDVFS